MYDYRKYEKSFKYKCVNCGHRWGERYIDGPRRPKLERKGLVCPKCLFKQGGIISKKVEIIKRKIQINRWLENLN